MVVVSLGTKGISASWTDGGNPIKPPPKGLEPIGDSGWYKSPDDLLPGDRLYCEYNPGSPVCGGNPFTNQGVGIDAEINVDPCGVSTRLSGAIAFVKVPEIQLTYRKAGACRREYEQPDPPPQVPPPPPANQPPPKLDPPGNINTESQVILVLGLTIGSYEVTYGKSDPTNTLRIRQSTWSTNSGRLIYPESKIYPYDLKNQPAYCSVIYGYTAQGSNTGYSYDYGGQVEFLADPSVTVNSAGFKFWEYRSGDPNNVYFYDIYVFSGKYKWIKAYLERQNMFYAVSHLIDETSTSYAEYWDYQARYPIAWKVLDGDYSKNPPIPLAEKRDCCMQCCFSAPSSQQNNNDSCCKEVLEIVKRIDKNLGTYPGKVTIFDSNEDAEGAQSKVIEFSTVAQGFSRAIERIEKISKIIGIDLLPVTVPKTVVQPINDNFFKVAWDFITPDATEKIENLFEWHVWNLKQMSALIGDFQRYVEIEDKEETITKEDGTQETKTTTKKIPLPDIATSLVEIVKNQIVLHREMGLTLDVCMKTLVSSCNTKQEVAKVFAELSEIVDWLDYPTREKSLEVPIQISIPPEGASDADKEDIHKFLQPGKTMIKYNDWDGTNSFKDFMIHLATLMSRNARG